MKYQKKGYSKLALTLLCFLGVVNTCFSQFNTTLPVSEQVTTGKLKNGLTYYILHNEWPKDRVSFYFVQNVGAILENKSQNGLAHFLEHMAFNGTEHFKGKGFINMLEKHGVQFGADINAYTALDETVYNISNVPVSDDVLVDSCMYVLHDWSGSLLLDGDEIDAERGVIQEEWRTRNNASFRLQSQINPILYKGSKYATHDVIGSMDVVNNFKHQELKDYYKKWYRPDLQAVVIVGDIDPAEIEAKVKDIFSPIPLMSNAAERYYVSVPENKKMQYILAKDKEAQGSEITLYYKKELPRTKDLAYLKNQLINSLCISMISDRYQQLLQSPETSSLSLSVGLSGLSRVQDMFYISATPKKGENISSFKEALIEVERAKRYGFTSLELERAYKNMMSSYENYLNNIDKVDNDSWAGQLTSYFLTADPFQEPQKEYKRVMSMLQSITVDDLNQAVKKFQTKENCILSVSGPDNDEVSFPSKKDFVAAMSEVEGMKLKPYVEENLDAPLIKDQLKGSSIQEEFKVPNLNEAKGYILSNGARIVLYPTTLSKDQILFYAFSKGGFSQVSKDDLPSAHMATSLVEGSGLGDFKATDLGKKLAGKIVSISPYINNYNEGLSGSSSENDFETLLQLCYLYFEHPRFEKDAFQNIMTQSQNSLENIESDNSRAMRDTVTLLNSNYNERSLLFNQDYIHKMDMTKAQAIYHDRMSNAADFTFVFVGNLNDRVLSLVQTYIGSINSKLPHTAEGYVNYSMKPAKGISEREFFRPMDVPKTSIYLHLTDSLEYNRKNNLTLYLISQLLSKQYMNDIREEEGGSYGVSVQSSLSKIPSEKFSVVISFDCAPDKKNTLMDIVDEHITKLSTSLPNESDFNEIKSSLLKNRAEGILSNSFWLGSIINYEILDQSILSNEEYEALLNEITPAVVRDFAKKYLLKANRVKVIMNASDV